MRTVTQTRIWIAIFLGLFVLLYILKPVLFPFVAGLVLAYFLAPVVNLLEKRWKVPRWAGALLVIIGFLTIAASLLTLIMPMISHQLLALVSAAPIYIEKIRTNILPGVMNWLARFSPDDVEKFKDAAGEQVGEVAGWAGERLKYIVSSGFALIDAIALAIITPVTAFFTLRDWRTLVKTVDGLFPRAYYRTIKQQLDEIDRTLSGFIRGQALVCLALGFIYSAGLTIAGLQYGLAIGVTAGVLSFIPYVGSFFGWVTSLTLALVQFEGDWTHIGSVIAVFLVGHFLEAYVLTPRLVGHRVGLHPLWILFALIAGAKLLGFMGILIAVPTAAVLGVLVRFFVRQYKASALYKA